MRPEELRKILQAEMARRDLDAAGVWRLLYGQPGFESHRGTDQWIRRILAGEAVRPSSQRVESFTRVFLGAAAGSWQIKSQGERWAPLTLASIREYPEGHYRLQDPVGETVTATLRVTLGLPSLVFQTERLSRKRKVG